MNSTIDTTVIIVFSVFIMLIGFLFARTGRNLKSFFAGGEAVPWFIGGLSLFMSFFSAGTFVAWGSIAYQHGWVAITIQWTMCIGGLITGLYLAPRWKATGNLTAAEFIRERLGEKVQKTYIYIFMLVSLFIKGSVLYSVSKLVAASLDFPIVPATVVLGLFMIAYTAVGGLWAVMVTDILQFVILTAAILIIIPLAFNASNGVEQFLQKAPERFFNVVNGEFTWGFILAFALYHIFYIGGNWTFVQRYTSVDTPKSASKVAFLFAGLYIISPILWMLPPMVYKTINPSLAGLDTENAYLMICRHVLPAGLMGLILTGMYFSTSASANTALNVVSAVFTNDIYKANINPNASDRKLISVARISSWFFGLGMIGIALIVPYIGGIVEFTLSIGAVTGGPLLAPPIWALFSKRLSGKTTMYVTLVSLTVNLIFKMLLPLTIGFKLSRGTEMLVGVGLPFLMLALFEWYAHYKGIISDQYIQFKQRSAQRKQQALQATVEETNEIKRQNRFGLRVIAFSLIFIAVLLFILSALTASGKGIVAGIAAVILVCALIPFRASNKFKEKAKATAAVVGAVMLPCFILAQQPAANKVELSSGRLQLSWHKTGGGWQLKQLSVLKNNKWGAVPGASGEYTILFSSTKPDSTPITIYNEKNTPLVFPEPQYRYIIPVWHEAVQPVAMNRAGDALSFYPADVTRHDKALQFTQDSKQATVKALWQIDARYETDVVVHITLTAKQDGYYSIASPSLATVANNELAWGIVPGHFQGTTISKNFIQAYAYGQGIPDKPVITHDRTASTLSPLLSNKNGITMAVIPAPGTSRDPWMSNAKTQAGWQLGLSLMNRRSQLTPVAWHPVLGQKGSYLKNGETVQFSFRYSVQAADWYTVYKHAVNDIYRLKDFLALKQTSQSLTDRILSMQRYVVDDSTSKWKVEQYKGMAIGAQQYLGGVHGAQKDAIKNADYGAMWMLAKISHDSVLSQTRLPYVRNFKLAQQDTDAGFFQGAAAGQYYLTQGKKFTEEWGPYVEPIATTYYMLMDIGNVLLFNPTDTALKTELQLAADRLLAWMSPHGQWAVAYDHDSKQPLFTDIEDLRPTFYGLLIAYRLLGDKKYLTAARKGADWYIANAVNKGHFTGVCGDTRFAPDFATGQSAQALIDLYEITKDKKYQNAGIQAARLYTTSVYTHPIPTREEKLVKGKTKQDWEISQVGLSFEHGGTLGSANHAGPILLASHAGMFVRMFSLTRDSLFLTMARAAALGRDAFVDKKTNVASYYWGAMDNGPGSFPHHAWWQIGWITDYLLSEVELRTNGKVSFPRGFITPKVGPHQTYGFAAGSVFGNSADLFLKQGLLTTTNAQLDHFAAVNTQQKKLWLLLLNNDDDIMNTSVTIDYSKAFSGQPKKVVSIDADGKQTALNNSNNIQVTIPAYGIKVIEIDL
jgi:SSS family transporter